MAHLKGEAKPSTRRGHLTGPVLVLLVMWAESTLAAAAALVIVSAEWRGPLTVDPETCHLHSVIAHWLVPRVHVHVFWWKVHTCK